MLVNPVTLEYENISDKTSQFLNRTNITSLKLPKNEYKNFILVRRGNIFQKKFRKTKSIQNMKFKVVKNKKSTKSIFPTISKNSLYTRGSSFLPSIKNKNILAEKFDFLEKNKKNLIKKNGKIIEQKKRFKTKKRDIQKKMLNTKQFLRDNFKKIQFMKKSLKNKNFFFSKKKEFLSNHIVIESRKIYNIKEKINKLNLFLKNLQNKVNIQNIK